MKSITFDETKWQLVPIEPTYSMLYLITPASAEVMEWKTNYSHMLQSAPHPEPVDVEHVATMFQHGDTGNTTFIESHLTNDFSRMNKRHVRVCDLFAHPDPEIAKLRAQVAVAREALDRIHGVVAPYDDGIKFGYVKDLCIEALTELGEK